MRISLSILLIMLIAESTAFSQSTFLREYNRGNIGMAVREVAGNKYVTAGATDFYMNWHWHLLSSFAATDIHFFQTNSTGDILWEKIYGSNISRSMARWFEPTSDGGFIIAGYDNKDKLWPPDSNDVALIKTDANGVITWSKLFDSGKDELGYCVRETSDGGFIVSAFHDAAPVSLVGNTYVLLIRTDASGNILWSQKYGLAVRDLVTQEPFPYIVKQTADGGFVVVGTTIASHPADVYVIRIAPNGNLIWAKSFEHNIAAFRFSSGFDIIEVASGDFVIAGAMDKDRPAGKYNYPYILRITSAGNLVDYSFYETNPLLTFQTGFSSVVQTPDGGFFFTGMGGYAGFGDQAQLLKTDANFNMQWSRVYSWDGIATMGSRSGRWASDGGYLFTGKRQMAGTIVMKTDGQGLLPCKIPGSLVEYTPGLVVQNQIPVVLPALLSISNPFITQSPLTDTSTLCPPQLMPMPVELNYFGAQPLPNKCVGLRWSTSSELNSDYFEVQRSTDGTNFEEAGKISGAGNSWVALDYSFIDQTPFPSLCSYYRLKLVDFDGHLDFSPVVSVCFDEDGFELISANADVAGECIKIYLMNGSSETIEYAVTDVYGKNISKGIQSGGRGMMQLSIPAQYLSRGIYFLSFSNGRQIISERIFF